MYEAYIKGGNSDNDFDFFSKKGEFVFLLNRSTSMKGARIENAKKALALFLKSLPIDSYFQVCSFGDSYE